MNFKQRIIQLERHKPPEQFGLSPKARKRLQDAYQEGDTLTVAAMIGDYLQGMGEAGQQALKNVQIAYGDKL